MNDKISMNTETLQAKVAGNDNDIRHLLRLVGDLSSKYALLERTINGRKTVVNGHTSAMPDYKGENRDHDARYATRKSVELINGLSIVISFVDKNDTTHELTFVRGLLKGYKNNMVGATIELEGTTEMEGIVEL